MQLGFANRVAKPSIRNRKNNYGREEEGEGDGKKKKKRKIVRWLKNAPLLIRRKKLSLG